MDDINYDPSNSSNSFQNSLQQFHVSTVHYDYYDSDNASSYDLNIELTRLERKTKEIEERIEVEKVRKQKAKEFYENQKKIENSIFNQRGLTFRRYTEKHISMVFSPSAFSKTYIGPSRKYYVSLRYNKKWWYLKKMEVPNKEELLKLFHHEYIVDELLKKTLFNIYECLLQHTMYLINYKKLKHERYLKNDDIWLDSDDENLFLTPDERKQRKENIKKIWSRMLPPTRREVLYNIEGDASD